MPEIKRLLILSTAHIAPAQRENMTSIADDIEYGWLMWAYDERSSDDIGDELWAACEYARANGCDYIMFDRDADAIDDLPKFDW